MAVELDHDFPTDKPLEESYASLLDLERVVPAVEGGSVTEVVSPEKVKGEILIRMGAMSIKLIGTVEVVEKDETAHTALLRVRSRESGGTGHANADFTFQLRDGGGTIHTHATTAGPRSRRARTARPSTATAPTTTSASSAATSSRSR